MTAKFRSRSIADLMLALALAPGLVSTGAAAQQPPGAAVGPDAVAPPRGAQSAAAEVPADYIIGPEDVLSIVYWRDKDMTGDVVGQVRRQDLAAASQRRAGGRPDTDAAARSAGRGLQGLLRRSGRLGWGEADEQPEGVHHGRSAASPARIRWWVRPRCWSSFRLRAA